MENQIPKFMTEKREIIKFLLFVIFWVIIYSIIYHPDVVVRGLEFKDNQYKYYLSIMIFVGYLMLIISRFIFYKLNKRKPLEFKHLCWWIIQEMILISITLSLVSNGLVVPNSRPFFTTILPRTTISTVSLLVIPYTIFWLYSALQEKNFQLKEILNKRGVILDKEIINFYDEKGVFRLSVRQEDLLYAQSADNYVFIHYLNSKNELSKFMLRNTLKYIEEGFPNMNLVRCHRFYVVNLSKVKVLRKGKDGLILELDAEFHTEIPVSKTYATKIAELFTNG